MEDHTLEIRNPRLFLVKMMNVSKKYKGRVIGKSISAMRSAKRALYAAAALHTIAPLFLLTCLMIPLVLTTHG